MNYKTYFSKQARRPSGLFGLFFMSRVFEKGNVALNDLMFETLSIQENDRVLEIGFGTGRLIQKIAARLDQGCVEGIDFSKSMVAIAQKRNRKHIRSGKVQLHLGDFDAHPFEADTFDKIFTVNTIYFWQHPEKTMANIARILKPGGEVLIGFHDKSEMEKMPLNTDVFRYYSTDDVCQLLSVHGSLTDIDCISRKAKQGTCYCAVGTK